MVVGPDPVWVREEPPDETEIVEGLKVDIVSLRARNQEGVECVETSGVREEGTHVTLKVIKGDVLEHGGFGIWVGPRGGCPLDAKEKKTLRVVGVIVTDIPRFPFTETDGGGKENPFGDVRTGGVAEHRRVQFTSIFAVGERVGSGGDKHTKTSSF